MNQERMSIEDLARFLPDEARFVAMERERVWHWFSGKRPGHDGAVWIERAGKKEPLSILPAIDAPWDESLTEIRPKPRWRAAEGAEYWVSDLHGSPVVFTEHHSPHDDGFYEFGDYWPTPERAQAYADACKKLAMKMHEEADE